MANNTFISVPLDLTDEEGMKRFLYLLIEKINVVFGNLVQEGYLTTEQVSSDTTETVGSFSTTFTARIAELETQLQSTTAQLQSTATELQSTTAELQSTNTALASLTTRVKALEAGN